MIRSSLSGIRFYGSCEGCILHAYHGAKDLPGVMTIYYGHVCRPGEVYLNTQADADAYLVRDTAWAQSWLWRHCPWTAGDPLDPESASYGRQHNFDALIDLTLNVGHVFDDVLAEVNGANRPDEVKRLWLSHARAGNDAHALDFRRAKEVAFYLTPDPPLFSEEEVKRVMGVVDLTSRRIIAEAA